MFRLGLFDLATTIFGSQIEDDEARRGELGRFDHGWLHINDELAVARALAQVQSTQLDIV